MGLYDSVWLRCPRCGGISVEVQSQANGSHMKSYTEEDAPPNIIQDIDNQTCTCDSCHAKWKIDVRPQTSYRVYLV
jgi:hypothetical protein